MKTATLLALIPAAAAFSAPAATKAPTSALFSTVDETVDAAAPEEPVVAPINGWVPDESLPCYGLPGAIAPTGFFDPLGFCQDGIPL